MTLDLTGNHCPVIFTAVFFSFSRNNACKNTGFPEPALAANARFAEFIVYKKALFGKHAARKKKNGFCTRYLWKKKEKPAN